MKLIDIRNKSKNASRMMCLVAASGLAMSGSMAMAQSSGSNNTIYEDDMEYEPGEGVHEEEWYDPTDWWDDDFDGRRGPTLDYEYDDWGTDSDWDDDYRDNDQSYAVYDGESYEASWWHQSNSELYNDGYYNGYLDGYDDDEFGYDHNEAANGSNPDGYSTGYASGYYDGYYDQTKGYKSDWTYYIYITPADESRERASRERSRDDSRERGDRSSEAGTDSMSPRQASNDAMNRDKTRMRGTVTKVEHLKDSKLSSKMKDHRVVRLTFEDGNKVVADLGKKADKQMIEKGDRVTVCGERTTNNGRKMIDVSRLTVNDEVMWNASDYGQPQQVSSR
tara:strand:- start:18904 stop:19908 length:1005 start_codon:yes stop_codon:yes gene_type:complete